MKNHLDLITVMPLENVTILTGAKQVATTEARREKKNPFA